MSESTHYVLSYVNPDTDGVTSCLVYSDLEKHISQKTVIPVVFGKINNETHFVLKKFNVTAPEIVTEVPIDAILTIIDTHHIKQLTPNLSFSQVREIIDHHTGGNPEAFQNAKIQNEKVGSVGTLLAERYRIAELKPTEAIAGLMYAAIISNTLGFRAPTTTDRDKLAVEWLSSIVQIPGNFEVELFEARSDLSEKTTLEVLESDFKAFEFSGVSVGIAQLETTYLSSFLSRSDLGSALLQLKDMKGTQHIFFNGADILKEEGFLVAPDASTRSLLANALNAEFTADRAYFDRILLRKTDLIPPLEQFLLHNSMKSF